MKMLAKIATATATLALAGLIGCSGAPDVPDETITEEMPDHHKVDEPKDQPTTQAADVLPNDGTRQEGDVTSCLVSGEVFTVKADTKFAEHEGKKYYVCCPGCVDKFNADPAKFIANPAQPKLASTEAALPNDGTRQVGEVTTCPVSGEKFTIKEDSPKAEHEGGTYYFCCGGCVGKFQAEPAKYLTAK